MEERLLTPARVNPLLLHERERRLGLDGDWRFRLDPDDVGVNEHWFRSGAQLKIGTAVAQTPVPRTV